MCVVVSMFVGLMVVYVLLFGSVPASFIWYAFCVSLSARVGLLFVYRFCVASGGCVCVCVLVCCFCVC